MAIRGRRPNLSIVRDATGNPGKRKINELEPKPEGEAVRPAFVTGRARRLWDQIAPDMIKQGILTPWDAHSFGRLCCEWAEWEKNPAAFSASRKAEMRKHETQFGLGDPAGRSRIKGNGKGKKEEPGQQFYA